MARKKRAGLRKSKKYLGGQKHWTWKKAGCRRKVKPKTRYQYLDQDEDLRGLSSLCALCGLPWIERCEWIYGEAERAPHGAIDDAPICFDCSIERPTAMEWIVNWIEGIEDRNRAARGPFRTVINAQERLHG